MYDSTSPLRPDRQAETTLARLALGAADPLPAPVIRLILGRLLAGLTSRHPRARAHLEELTEADLLLVPTDLPRAFRMRVGRDLGIHLARRNDTGNAVIRGRFADLLDLLEGRIDGDALFFHRALAIEGDMELVVAVRNILDGAGIALTDAGGALAPVLAAARTRLAQLAFGLDRLRGLTPSGLSSRLDRLEHRIDAAEAGRR
jgi:predicted lipid carrier protein YhbT